MSGVKRSRGLRGASSSSQEQAPKINIESR